MNSKHQLEDRQQVKPRELVCEKLVLHGIY